MSGMKRITRLLEAALVVTCVLGLGVLLWFAGINHKLNCELKHSLWEIQIEVERYAVDHDGNYPSYLVGGEPRWSAQVDVSNRSVPFSGTIECPTRTAWADPLLREGYLTAYPRNPFAKNGVGVHQTQLTLPLNFPGDDPLRNGAFSGRVHGTRFGAECTRMGQVLGAKYHYIAATTISQDTNNNPSSLNINSANLCSTPLPGLLPGADTTYRCWGIWTDKHARNPLPGQFIYSAIGPVAYLMRNSRVQHSGAQQHPESGFVEMDQFVLAVFGSPRIKGKDRLDAAGSPWCLRSSPSLDVLPFASDGIADGILMMRTQASDLPD